TPTATALFITGTAIFQKPSAGSRSRVTAIDLSSAATRTIPSAADSFAQKPSLCRTFISIKIVCSSRSAAPPLVGSASAGMKRSTRWRTISNGSMMTAPGMPQRLKDIRARGGKVILIDPRRNETAALVDHHLFIRPGTDALFLLALLHVLFAEGLTDLGALASFTAGLEKISD